MNENILTIKGHSESGHTKVEMDFLESGEPTEVRIIHNGQIYLIPPEALIMMAEMILQANDPQEGEDYDEG